jgi:hypothetical protein
MFKRRSTRRTATADKSATTDIVTQLQVAFRRPEATLIGALVGGLVPWFARTLAHDQLPAAWSRGNSTLAGVMLAVVLGCALFSAITVYKFGRATFNDTRKALGFVLAIEGVMLVSNGATSNVALFVLILINALANGSSIALARDATCKRQEADARRAATRAKRSAPKAPAIPFEDKTARAPRAPKAPAHKAPVVPVWTDLDIDDAEIISEQKYLA